MWIRGLESNLEGGNGAWVQLGPGAARLDVTALPDQSRESEGDLENDSERFTPTRRAFEGGAE